MKKLFFIFFLLLALSFLKGCTTGPDFNRNNTKDPKSEYYVPELPENSPISIALDNSRNVILSWDQKELQDGVIIEKKYQPDSPFVQLDTLFGHQLNYTDDSGAFVPGTTYKVDFFRFISDSSFVFNKEPAQVSLNFQPFEDIFIHYDNRLEISYDYSGNPNEGMFQYFDGVEIMVNTSANSASQKWDTVGSIGHKEFTNDFVRSDFTIELFDLHIKVNQFIADSSGNRIPLKSESRRFYINSIDNVSFEFIDELSGTVRWTNKVSFGDGYIIESNRIDTVFGTQKNSYHLSLTEALQLPFEVYIKPFINENFGETLTTTSPRYPHIITPEIYEFKPLDHNSFEIGWRIFQDDQAAGYIIEQSRLPENTYTPLDTVSADQRSYVVSNLDQNREYNIAVHSYTSEWSRYITIGYQNTFVPIQSDQLDIPGTKITYSKSGKYMAKHVPSEFSDNYEYILIKDLDTNAEYTIEIPREFDDWRAVFREFAISEKNNTLIFLWDRDYVDEAGDYISVYDFINNQYLIENKPTPLDRGYKIELMSDDDLVVIYGANSFTVFDSENDMIVREISFENIENGILRPHKDTAIRCSESGIFEYDLTNGDIVNQSNEYCLQGHINESSNLLTFLDNNSVKVLDLNTFATINTIEDERFDWNVATDFWYFEEDELLIYRDNSGIYSGYDVSQNIEFAFILPSYTENRISGHIETMEREPDGSYSIITFDGKFTYRYEEHWSLIRKQPRNN